MRIISTIVKIKREQDSLVSSNRIQVNAWCTNWVIYVLVIFYDFVNSACGGWALARGLHCPLPFGSSFCFLLCKKNIINKNVISINVKNFTNNLYISINSDIFPVWLSLMQNIRHCLIWCTVIITNAVKVLSRKIS